MAKKDPVANEKFWDARQRLNLSRSQLADDANREPVMRTCMHAPFNENYIGRIEQGRIGGGMCGERIAALCARLDVDDPAEIGLVAERRLPTRSAPTRSWRQPAGAATSAAMGLGYEGDVPWAVPQGLKDSLDRGAGTDLDLCDSTPAGRDSVLANLRGLRRQLDEALAASTVSPLQLRLIEESTNDHIRRYPSSPPASMLQSIAAECVDVVTLSRRRQPAAVQSRLSGCAALLATMAADALMRLGVIDEAQSWYRTALVAADDSTQVSLAVLVRAQAAMLPYYYGDPGRTVALADQALAISDVPSASSALAAAARARALARLGAHDQVSAALEDARRLFDEASTGDGEAAFQFPAKRMLFYLSGAACWSGDTATAYGLQDEALALYKASGQPSIDPTLMCLDRSAGLVQDRRAEEAAALARTAVAALAESQRTEIVLTRAHDVLMAIPPAERSGAASDLADYLHECRRRALTLMEGRAVIEQ